MEAPGRCGDWLDTATVTARASASRPTRRTRDEDFYLTTTEDHHLATCEDFFMAMDMTNHDGAIKPRCASPPMIQHYVTQNEVELGLDQHDLPAQCLKLGEEVGELYRAIRKLLGHLQDPPAVPPT